MGKQGEFFAIDRRTWGEICNSSPINEAVAYLVLAQGTGGSNRTTAWSATSLKTYTGISWNRAVPAIESLTSKGFIRKAESHTREKPRYELPRYHEIEQAILERKRAALSAYDQLILADIKAGKRINKHTQSIRQLESQGFIKKTENGYTVVESTATEEPDWIWLPNTIVTGTDRGEDPPIRRLRSAGDLWALRLFIDLYHAQNLRDDGGISPAVIRKQYERQMVGEQGIFNVWGFTPGNQQLFWTGPFLSHRDRARKPDGDHPVWDTVRSLETQGLLSFVPHLWDHDPVANPGQGEIIHAYGLRGAGEQPEIDIATAAHCAGQAMVPEFKLNRGDRLFLAPVERTLPDVQMVGVARLHYRPKTRRTKDWWAEVSSNAEKWVSHYNGLREKAEKSRAQIA